MSRRNMCGIHLMNALSVCVFVACMYYLVSSEVTSPEGKPHASGALSVVPKDEQEDDSDGKVTVEENGVELEQGPDEKLGVFHPTKEWKKISPGQAVPAGLHVRLDLQTGQKEGKLMEGDEGPKYWKSGEKEGMVNPNKDFFTHKELKEALKEFKTSKHDGVDTERQEKVMKKFKSYSDIKKEFADMHIGIKTDVEIVSEMFQKLNSTSVSLEDKLSLLEDLEFYLHQIDNAQLFSDMGGIKILVTGINDTDINIRMLSAFALGSAVQSNPKVQISALEAGAIQQLIRCLSTQTEHKMLSKTLYAVSSLIRHFPYAQKLFLEVGGLSALKNLFRMSGGESTRLQVRAASLIQDLIVEEEDVLKIPESSSEFSAEKLRQYEQVNLKVALKEQGVCSLIPPLLEAPDHDSREKILKTMQVLTSVCRDSFQESLNTLTSLQTEYQTLAAEEEEGDKYFDGIVQCITEIMSAIPVKDEL